MKDQGLLVCETIPMRGHGMAMYCYSMSHSHVTLSSISGDRCFFRFFLQQSRNMFDEEYHPFKSCVLRKLYNPPKLKLMIS